MALGLHRDNRFCVEEVLVKTQEQRQKKIDRRQQMGTDHEGVSDYSIKYLVFGVVSCFHLFSYRNVKECNACTAIKKYEFMLVLPCLNCEHKG